MAIDVESPVAMTAIICFVLFVVFLLVAVHEHHEAQDALVIAYANQEALQHCREDKQFGENVTITSDHAQHRTPSKAGRGAG